MERESKKQKHHSPHRLDFVDKDLTADGCGSKGRRKSNSRTKTRLREHAKARSPQYGTVRTRKYNLPPEAKDNDMKTKDYEYDNDMRRAAIIVAKKKAVKKKDDDVMKDLKEIEDKLVTKNEVKGKDKVKKDKPVPAIDLRKPPFPKGDKKTPKLNVDEFGDVEKPVKKTPKLNVDEFDDEKKPIKKTPKLDVDEFDDVKKPVKKTPKLNVEDIDGKKPAKKMPKLDDVEEKPMKKLPKLDFDKVFKKAPKGKEPVKETKKSPEKKLSKSEKIKKASSRMAMRVTAMRLKELAKEIESVLQR